MYFTYILLFGSIHERCDAAPTERVWIRSIAQQKFEAVDVLQRYEVDWSPEEIATVWVSTTT